ncbi:MAG: zinc ribbon domain-containing protein [Bacteroidales bacterium]
MYPLSRILKCGYCGKPMCGVSSTGIRYYRGSSRIEKTCDCPQIFVRADEIESSLVKVFQEIVDYSVHYGRFVVNGHNDAQRGLPVLKIVCIYSYTIQFRPFCPSYPHNIWVSIFATIFPDTKRKD